MVEADLDGDAMVVDAEGRLHFRRLSNPVAVLPGVIDMGMKYIASVVAGNAPRSAQTLVRLLIAQPPLDMEKNLMEEFSGVEPELKINMWFPPSAEHFESNWRALAKIAPSRPLFVDCLHRNLLAAGYWTSDAAAAGGARVDSISEAMWPAISQLLKSQFGALLSREQIQEWALGSGMLFISTLREMNRSLEEMRENDITVGVDCSDWRGEPRRSPARAYPAMLAVLLAVFLVCLQWGPSAPEPWPLVLKIAAAGSLAAMFWVVSRIR
jgi:hypothetical protein